MITTIEKIEKGHITLAEFSKDQQSFIRGIVKLSYNEGLEQGQKLTTPVDVENKELPVYKVVFNEGTGSGVASINLTKTPLFNAKQTGEHLRSSCDWCNPPQHQ
jgi:hypothetical protein